MIMGTDGLPNKEQLVSSNYSTPLSTTEKQLELAKMAQQQLFGTENSSDALLNNVEREFLVALQSRLEAVINGQGEQIFSQSYLQRRAFMVEAVGEHDYRLYTPVDEELAEQFKIFQSENAAANSQCGELYGNNGMPCDKFYIIKGCGSKIEKTIRKKNLKRK